MHKHFTTFILYGSPLVLTVALGIVGFGIHAVGRGFGSTRSSAPIVIAAAVVWLLHAGFILGPWLYLHQRQGLALWLMIPVAIAGVTVAVLIAKQLTPADSNSINAKFIMFSALWALVVLLGYLAPVAVMLAPRNAPHA